jgi:transcriptional regulator with XRE-family HTH domain
MSKRAVSGDVPTRTTLRSDRSSVKLQTQDVVVRFGGVALDVVVSPFPRTIVARPRSGPGCPRPGSCISTSRAGFVGGLSTGVIPNRRAVLARVAWAERYGTSMPGRGRTSASLRLLTHIWPRSLSRGGITFLPRTFCQIRAGEGPSTTLAAMDDHRCGGAFRAVRIKRGWTQQALADRAGTSRTTISRIERGHLGTFSVGALRRVAAALDIRVDLVPRWRAGDLDRLLNAKHSQLHEMVARWFASELPAWVLAPEVSYAIYGERGVIDIVAWHPGRRAILVIELKTDIVDVNQLIGKVGEKARLIRQIVKDRGWDPLAISTWVIVAAGRTNRARLAAHQSVVRAAFPAGGRAMRGWLADPRGSIAGLSTWAGSARRSIAPVRRVRRSRQSTPPR